MINIKPNQGNAVVPITPGTIADWNLDGVALITLLGNPNRSYIKGAPGNSLQPDELISEGLYIFGGSAGLDRSSFFYPTGAAALATPTLTAVATGPNSIHLTANAVTGATSYRFMQKVGTVWTVIQNLPALEFEVGNLDPGTEYDFRVQAAGNGTTTTDSAFALASATTQAAPSYIFRDTFTDTDKAYASHTPEAGTITILTGTGAINQNQLLLTPASQGGYAVARINGATTGNLEAGIDVDISQMADGDLVAFEVFESTDTTKFTLVSFTRASLTAGALQIVSDLGGQDTKNVTVSNGAIRLIARRVGNAVTGLVGSTQVTYTESRSGLNKLLKFQGNNGGRVDLLTVTPL